MALYTVEPRSSPPASLQDDVRFTECICSQVQSLISLLHRHGQYPHSYINAQLWELADGATYCRDSSSVR
ncbi:hypothetical protein I7I48_07877 [Histoplasma ohiense]|nr:hypothetical protein I7I48_07877 [Histoplasma ohiense (nom. inval.)]